MFFFLINCFCFFIWDLNNEKVSCEKELFCQERVLRDDDVIYSYVLEFVFKISKFDFVLLIML